MNLPAWFRTPYADALGWTLLHSLWQLALLAAAGAITRAMLRRRSPRARYLAACLTLLLMLAAPVTTFVALQPARDMPAPTQAPTLMSAKYVDPQTGMTLPLALPVNGLPAPTPPPPSALPRWRAALERYLSTAVLFYFLGVALLGLRLAIGYWRLRRLIQGARPLAALQTTLDALARRMAVSTPVRLLESALVEVPTLIGALRPVILFPATALTGLSTQQLEAILAHELAHIRRHDYVVNLIQCVVETLLFYHPAVWWLSARIRQEREHCCDDAAMAITRDRILYARALAHMESLRAAPAGVAANVALAARGGALLPRIHRILGVPRPAARTVPLAAVMLLAAFVSAMIYVGCSINGTAPKAATTAPAGSDDAPIALEARWLLVPDAFLDDFRVGWDSYIVATAAPNPGTAESRMPVSIVDNWTLGLLLQATAADPQTFTYSLPIAHTGDFGDVRFFKKEPDPRHGPASQAAAPPASFALSFGVLPRLSLDRRSVELDVHDLATSGEPIHKESRFAGANAVEMIPNGTLSVPDGGTMLINVGTVAGVPTKYHCLLLLRPTITRPTGPRYVAVDGSITTQPAAAKPADDMIVLVYDVRDLISVRQLRANPVKGPESLDAMWREQSSADFGTKGFSTSAPATGPAQSMPPGYKQIMDSLMKDITAAVAPASWKANGGTGTIREFNGQLIVTQALANQKAVYTYIMQQRSAYAVRTALELKFLLVGDATLKSLALPKPTEVQSSAGTDAPAKTLAVSTIDASQLPALYKSAASAADTSSLTAPRVTLYDGLPGYISETNQQNIVSAVHSHKDDQGKPAANLDIKTISSGAMVHINASIAADRKSVTLAIHPSILALDRIETVMVPEAGMIFDSNTPAFYQKPVTHGTEYAVEAKVNDGQAIVITGDKFAGNFPVPDRMNVGGWNLSPPLPNAGERNLVLVVYPRIEVQNYNDLFVKSMDDLVRQGPGLP